MLYAADFSAGTVDVYNGLLPASHHRRKLPRRASCRAGSRPFNVAVLDGKVYVAYAKQDADREDEIAGFGLGRVDVFSRDGTLMRRLNRTTACSTRRGA